MNEEMKDVMKEAVEKAAKLERKTGMSKGGVVTTVVTGVAIVGLTIFGVCKVVKGKKKEYIDKQPGDIYGVEQDDEETEK